MQIGAFMGLSWQSRVIKFVTRSKYSHSAFILDEMSEIAASKYVLNGGAFKNLTWISRGSVIEAWDEGVRNISSVSAGHVPGTKIDVFEFAIPLTITEETDLLVWLDGEIGTPYDWTNVIRFVTRRPGDLNRDWFCSELVFAGARRERHELQVRTEPWEVPPDWPPRSTALSYVRTIVA